MIMFSFLIENYFFFILLKIISFLKVNVTTNNRKRNFSYTLKVISLETRNFQSNINNWFKQTILAKISTTIYLIRLNMKR